MDTLGFFVPPPFAIAHHLIRLWALHDGPWFSGPADSGVGAAASGPVMSISPMWERSNKPTALRTA